MKTSEDESSRAPWIRGGAPANTVGSEGRRALIATALGVAMGLLVGLFAKRDEGVGRDGARAEAEGRRGWRGKSAT